MNNVQILRSISLASFIIYDDDVQGHALYRFMLDPRPQRSLLQLLNQSSPQDFAPFVFFSIVFFLLYLYS